MRHICEPWGREWGIIENCLEGDWPNKMVEVSGYCIPSSTRSQLAHCLKLGIGLLSKKALFDDAASNKIRGLTGLVQVLTYTSMHISKELIVFMNSLSSTVNLTRPLETLNTCCEYQGMQVTRWESTHI